MGWLIRMTSRNYLICAFESWFIVLGFKRWYCSHYQLLYLCQCELLFLISVCGSSDVLIINAQPFVSLLDPVLHTPASTFARCPFLFTVGEFIVVALKYWLLWIDGLQVCAIASRYYVEKSEIYPIAMHFAKHSAANALIDGWKSVELCQAYILMSIYAVPARRWEEDRSWLYTGLAIRYVSLSVELKVSDI